MGAVTERAGSRRLFRRRARGSKRARSTTNTRAGSEAAVKVARIQARRQRPSAKCNRRMAWLAWSTSPICCHA